MKNNFNYYKEFAKHISLAIENFNIKFNPILEHIEDEKKNIILKDYQVFTSSVFLLEQMKSMLLLWGTGFGKTIQCIYLIKNIFKIYPQWKIFIIVKSSLKIDPWEKTIKEYLPKNIQDKIYMYHYNLKNSEQIFLLNLSFIKNERIFFVFDESHDFIKKIIPKDNEFGNTRRLTHVVKQIIKYIYNNPFNKVLFMTATPFNDSILEFNYIMNILRNNCLNLNEVVFNNQGEFLASILLENLTIGLTSYQKLSESNLFKNIKYENNLAGKQIFFTKILMSNLQSTIYKIVSDIELKNKARGFRILRRITNMFVFNEPKIRHDIDEKKYLEQIKNKFKDFKEFISKIHFSNNFIEDIKNESLKIYDNSSLSQNLNLKINSEIRFDSTLNFKNNYSKEIENLKTLNSFSSKYIKTCQIILQSRGKCAIYQPFVTFEGVKTLAEYFKIFNITYIEYTKNTKDERDDLVLKFNSKDNIFGEKIKVCIFSSAGIEGISFLNICDLIIMDIPWSGSELEQIIGRAIRLNSHNDLKEEERYVKIHILINYTNNDESYSIDEEMLNLIEKKEKYKNKYILLLKKTSIENIYKLYPNIEPIEQENLYPLINYKYDIKNLTDEKYSVLKSLIKIKFVIENSLNETDNILKKNIQEGYLDDKNHFVYQESQLIGKIILINKKKKFKLFKNEIIYYVELF